VINGEKVPAFSARTLQLPPAQTDNTAVIIEHTRTNYAQPREVVEEAINGLIQPPEHLQRKGPGNPGFKPTPHPNDAQAVQSAAQAKQWPIDAAAKPAQPKTEAPAPDGDMKVKNEPNRPKLIIETPEGEAAVTKVAQGGDEAPKKKRRRRKKSAGTEEGERTSTESIASDSQKSETAKKSVEKATDATPASKLKIHHETPPKPTIPPKPKPTPPKPVEAKKTSDDTMGLLRIR